MLAKIGWRMLQKPDSLLCKTLMGKYCPEGNILRATGSSTMSHGWRSILVGLDLLLMNLGWLVGDGKSIKIWYDPWLSTSNQLRPMGPPEEQTAELLVADLMTEDGSQWDHGKIQRILPLYEDLILSIKQSVTGAPDKLVWLGTKTGEYSVKSGYYKAVVEDDIGGVEVVEPNFNWTKNVWKLDVAPKVKLFAWKTLKGALPVGERLIERHIAADPQCKRCGCTESITHLLFQCRFARTVWRLAPLMIDVECSGMIELVSDWSLFCNSKCLPPAGIVAGNLFPWILWSLWKARNRFVFEGFSSSPEDTLTSAIVLAREWGQERKTEKSLLVGRRKTEQPCPDNTSVVKTDAAWDSNRQAAGLGWIVTTNLRTQTFHDHMAFVSSPLIAEALALREAITSCKRLKMTRVRFESDSAQLISTVNTRSGNLDLHGIVSDILSCCLDFEFVSFVWIPRERNTIADLVAKDALNASGRLIVDGAINALS